MKHTYRFVCQCGHKNAFLSATFDEGKNAAFEK